MFVDSEFWWLVFLKYFLIIDLLKWVPFVICENLEQRWRTSGPPKNFVQSTKQLDSCSCIGLPYVLIFNNMPLFSEKFCVLWKTFKNASIYPNLRLWWRLNSRRFIFGHPTVFFFFFFLYNTRLGDPLTQK